MTFKRPPPKPAKQMDGYTVKPRAPACAVEGAVARASVPIPKAQPVRHEGYRRLVAAMPCARCGKPGPSQAAHSDSAGKGMGIKSDDRTCYPLCADGPGWRGCHYLIGTGGMLSREQRRELEARYGAQTRAAIRAAGLWPKGLEEFDEA